MFAMHLDDVGENRLKALQLLRKYCDFTFDEAKRLLCAERPRILTGTESHLLKIQAQFESNNIKVSIPHQFDVECMFVGENCSCNIVATLAQGVIVTMEKLKNYYAAVVPAMIGILDQGVSVDSVEAAATRNVWLDGMAQFANPTARRLDHVIAFQVPGFQFYLAHGHPELVDHACLWSCANRKRSLEDMFFAAHSSIVVKLGPAAFAGIWPAAQSDASRGVFRVSIWRHESGLLLLQQDDYEHRRFPEMIGFEVDICLLNYDVDRELPRQRTWRLRGEDT